jgi:uncharacterized membrane protein (Fun14 family)
MSLSNFLKRTNSFTALFAIIVGVFLAGLAILQCQQIASVNWDKLEQASEGVINAVVNTTTKKRNIVNKRRFTGSRGGSCEFDCRKITSS